MLTLENLYAFWVLLRHWFTLWRPGFLPPTVGISADIIMNSHIVRALRLFLPLRVIKYQLSAPHPSLCFAAETPIPWRCIHHAFIAHVDSNPHRKAVIDHLGNMLTYEDLDNISACLAVILRDRGVGRGTRVCLLVERSIPFIVAVLAVLRAGSAYIPLDGHIVTDNSLLSMLDDAQPILVLISRRHWHRAAHVPFPSACLEDMVAESHRCDRSRIAELPSDITPLDIAYIIYTSGTTGQPKGVLVSHVNVTNLLCLSPGNLGIAPGVHVAQLLNVAFDMCAWEVLGCLMNGGTLHLRGPHRADWVRVMKTVNVVICTPSILAPHDPQNYPNLRVVATAGEPCPQSLADQWSTYTSFYNCCGPTEVTIVNTMHQHRRGRSLTIGKPTPNNSVYILDEDLRPVPRGTPGTMWAGGLGVCQGYLNRPDLNHSKFMPDSFSKRGGVMYNTGDIGRLREHGEFDHLGRVDEQVKIKGFRVELDGVSAAMQTCQGLEYACALLIGQELWAFFSPSHVSSEDVRLTAAKLQPYYAVPVKYKALSEMPLTSNGKIDKQRLRQIVELDA